ncbi:MAG: transcriptional attenuator, LytR family, partial [Cyanobacteria bacterium RYN_339]|nr:transcriptional attenuator, LytR family [Cyanobacteria bacterium RYN_339]
VVGWAKDLKREQVTQAMVPGKEAVIKGGWYWEADPEATKHVVSRFLTADQADEALPAAQYHVSLLDGVGDRRALARMKEALAKAGYSDVELAGPADQMERDHTEIIAQTADTAGAQALAATLGVGQVTVASTGVMGTDFTVIMGRDWLKP